MTTPHQTLNKQFDEFDRLIRPDDQTLKVAQAAHLDVRGRISNDKKIQNIHVADFLQGSYARHTMVKPPSDEYGELEKVDVDIILVTNIAETTHPHVVLDMVKTWLENEYGEGTAEVQSRSVKLSLPDVEVDLVPTSAPSEAKQEALKRYAEKAFQMEADHNDVLDPNEVFGPQWDQQDDKQWKDEPLRIPDTHAQEWQDTHPLATLEFTVDKNSACGKRFLAVVRALKWWRRQNFLGGGEKNPKSYPVEHMAGDHCPAGIQSVAEGLTSTFEGMRDTYRDYCPTSKPELKLRGLPASAADVISRLEQTDFNAFYEEIEKAASIARNALECADAREAAQLWQQLLGTEFKLPIRISGPAKAAGGFVAPASTTSGPSGAVLAELPDVSLSEDLLAGMRCLEDVSGFSLDGPWQREGNRLINRCTVTTSHHSKFVDSVTRWVVMTTDAYPAGPLYILRAPDGGVRGDFPNELRILDFLPPELHYPRPCLITRTQGLGRWQDDPEPTDSFSRLAWHAVRLIHWTEQAAAGTLLKPGDLFGHPLIHRADKTSSVNTLEDATSLNTWLPHLGQSGEVRLRSHSAGHHARFTTSFCTPASASWRRLGGHGCVHYQKRPAVSGCCSLRHRS